MTTLEFDKGVYSVEAAQSAAYRFIDRLTIVISVDGNKIVCEIEAVNQGVDLLQVLGDFKRELLDQQLRVRIGRETESVRHLILSLAFSRSGLKQ